MTSIDDLFKVRIPQNIWIRPKLNCNKKPLSAASAKRKLEVAQDPSMFPWSQRLPILQSLLLMRNVR